MYDIAIIGAGPAGSTLARFLSPRYKILLVERRDFQNPKTNLMKCCGGLLAPDAQNILARWQLPISKDILVDPQIFSVRTIDFNSDIERFYQRFYINIHREKFDSYLASLIPETVDFWQNCFFKNYEKRNGLFYLKLKKDEKELVVRTKTLIGAQGSGFYFFQQNTDCKKYVALQQWYKSEKKVPYFSAIFDPEITDFYSWTITKDDYLLVGSALEINREPDKKFEKLKQKLKKIGFSLDEKIQCEGAVIYRPSGPKDIYIGEKNMGFIGESAGFISPSSAEGISFALQTGEMMAEALNNNFDNFLFYYSKLTQTLKRKIFAKNLKSGFMYHPFSRKIIMKSGVQSLGNPQNPLI